MENEMEKVAAKDFTLMASSFMTQTSRPQEKSQTRRRLYAQKEQLGAAKYVCPNAETTLLHTNNKRLDQGFNLHTQSVNINRVPVASGNTLRISLYEIHQKAKQTAASHRSTRTPQARLRTQQKKKQKGM